eukprot:Rmarinus@m.2284
MMSQRVAAVGRLFALIITPVLLTFAATMTFEFLNELEDADSLISQYNQNVGRWSHILPILQKTECRVRSSVSADYTTLAPDDSPDEIKSGDLKRYVPLKFTSTMTILQPLPFDASSIARFDYECDYWPQGGAVEDYIRSSFSLTGVPLFKGDDENERYILVGVCVKLVQSASGEWQPSDSYGGVGCGDADSWSPFEYTRFYGEGINGSYAFEPFQSRIRHLRDPYVYALYITNGDLDFSGPGRMDLIMASFLLLIGVLFCSPWLKMILDIFKCRRSDPKFVHPDNPFSESDTPWPSMRSAPSSIGWDAPKWWQFWKRPSYHSDISGGRRYSASSDRRGSWNDSRSSALTQASAAMSAARSASERSALLCEFTVDQAMEALLTKEELNEYARYLHMDSSDVSDAKFRWVLYEGLIAPAPDGWEDVQAPDGTTLYRPIPRGNAEEIARAREATVTRLHPLDEYFRFLYRVLRWHYAGDLPPDTPAQGCLPLPRPADVTMRQALVLAMATRLPKLSRELLTLLKLCPLANRATEAVSTMPPPAPTLGTADNTQSTQGARLAHGTRRGSGDAGAVISEISVAPAPAAVAAMAAVHRPMTDDGVGQIIASAAAEAVLAAIAEAAAMGAFDENNDNSHSVRTNQVNDHDALTFVATGPPTGVLPSTPSPVSVVSARKADAPTSIVGDASEKPTARSYSVCPVDLGVRDDTTTTEGVVGSPDTDAPLTDPSLSANDHASTNVDAQTGPTRGTSLRKLPPIHSHTISPYRPGFDPQLKARKKAPKNTEKRGKVGISPYRPLQRRDSKRKPSLDSSPPQDSPTSSGIAAFERDALPSPSPAAAVLKRTDIPASTSDVGALPRPRVVVPPLQLDKIRAKNSKSNTEQV